MKNEDRNNSQPGEFRRPKMNQATQEKEAEKRLS